MPDPTVAGSRFVDRMLDPAVIASFGGVLLFFIRIIWIRMRQIDEHVTTLRQHDGRIAKLEDQAEGNIETLAKQSEQLTSINKALDRANEIAKNSYDDLSKRLENLMQMLIHRGRDQ